MDLNANVKLSKEELELVQNSDWILTKQAITEKLVQLFGEVYEEYRTLIQDTTIQDSRMQDMLIPEGKISKGEQYERLPYVMLDFPRKFEKENIFAVRSFFWWGNFFSITLHVSGKYKAQYFSSVDVIRKFSDWNFCVNENEWRHDFSEDNYLPFSQVDLKDQLHRSFIKLSKKIPLSEWNSVHSFYKEHFRQIIVNLVS